MSKLIAAVAKEKIEQARFPASASPFAHPSNGTVDISVLRSEKVGDHTEYVIFVGGAWGSTEQKEKRRYNDFVALAMKLRSNRVSLPSMPPKMMSPVGYLLNLNMTRGWISKRQAHLDSFLKRVTCTKKAFESDALLEFLSIDPQHWDAIKQAAGVEVVVTEGDEGAAAK